MFSCASRRSITRREIMVRQPAVGKQSRNPEGAKPERSCSRVEEKATIVWVLVTWHRTFDAIERGELGFRLSLETWRLMHIARNRCPSLIRRWKQVFPEHQYTPITAQRSIGPAASSSR
jgi:hypothetical protein